MPSGENDFPGPFMKLLSPHPYLFEQPIHIVRGTPDMMSASEGLGGHGNANVVREVA